MQKYRSFRHRATGSLLSPVTPIAWKNSTPPRKAREFLSPSALSGSEMIAPSGKFWMAMPSDSARALAAVIWALPERKPAYITPTAIPSGMLCSVTASTIIAVRLRLLFGPSACSLPTWRCGIR